MHFLTALFPKKTLDFADSFFLSHTLCVKTLPSPQDLLVFFVLFMFYWCARLGPLTVNNVGPLGAKALAEALKTNTTLRHLDLGRMLRSTTHCGGAFLMVPPARF